MKFVVVILLAFALLAAGCTTARQQAVENAKGVALSNANQTLGVNNNTLNSAALSENKGQPSLPNAEEIHGVIRQNAPNSAPPEVLPQQPGALPSENMNISSGAYPPGAEPLKPFPDGINPEQKFVPSPLPPPPPPMPVSPLKPNPA